MECIEHSLNGNPDFGRRCSVCITRNGDLITKIYLFVQLGAVIPSSHESKFAWVRRLGNALIHSVEIEIGGSRIDKQYGVWLNIWWELARHAGEADRGYFHMIGDVPELTAYDCQPKPCYYLYVPLKFWFNRHVGLALPLIALQYHEVRLHFEFSCLEELIVTNKYFRHHDLRCVEMKDAMILVDYIYLDSEERRRFAQVGHEYLIEQLQFTGEETAQCQTMKYKLDFNHPTKELIWAVRNGNYICGRRFLCYTDLDDWCEILEECACKILLDSIALLPGSICDVDQYGNPHVVSPGEEPPCEGDWEPFSPDDSGFTKNGRIFVDNQCPDKCLWINTSSLRIKCRPGYILTDKIYADIYVDKDCNIKCTNIKTDLTVRDISFPVDEMIDTRANRDDDVFVFIPNNFGVLIDGTGNPVEFALIQLNGHDRFDRREGPYFNYVQPDQHHTNTPADGINVYSFALHPEQHQPSGTCNLSRIDNTQLNVWYWDPTHRPGLPVLPFLGCDNKVYIYGLNYNVKFSGVKKQHATNIKALSVVKHLFTFCFINIYNNNNNETMTVASCDDKIRSFIMATPSNCGDPLKSFVLNYRSNSVMAQISELRYSKIQMNKWASAQASAYTCEYRYALQRLNVGGLTRDINNIALSA